MTTISYPTSNVGSMLIGAAVGAAAMLLLVAALAIAALNAPATVSQPLAAPMTIQSSGFDGTPHTGVLEFAD